MYYFDKTGKAVAQHIWSALRTIPGYAILAHDETQTGKIVHTEWHGLSDSLTGSGNIRTTILDPETGEVALEIRSRTEADALHLHEYSVAGNGGKKLAGLAISRRRIEP